MSGKRHPRCKSANATPFSTRIGHGICRLMIAVLSSGPYAVDLTLEDTRARGTLQTGASGVYVGRRMPRGLIVPVREHRDRSPYPAKPYRLLIGSGVTTSGRRRAISAGSTPFQLAHLEQFAFLSSRQSKERQRARSGIGIPSTRLGISSGLSH
jgi:hypothetical protein